MTGCPDIRKTATALFKLSLAILIVLAPMRALGSDFNVQYTVNGLVTDVRAGDEIVVGDLPIRLNGIAAPPEFQPMGGDSKAFLQWLVLEKIVRCDLNGERSRGRHIGICYLDDVDIGRTVVREGFARDCPRFSKGRYAKDETSAKPTGIQDLYPLPEYCGLSL